MSTSLVVEKPKTKLVDELHAAETALRSAQITLRTIETNIAAGRKSIPEQEQALEKVPPPYRSDRALLSLRIAKSWLCEEEAKLPIARTAVDDAQRAVGFIQSKIAKDPMYASVVAKRREFTARGVELARRAWTAPLLHVTDLVRQYEAVADAEQNFVLRENSGLAQAGLPQLTAVLAGRSDCLPEMITRMDIARLMSEAGKLITEMASR